MIRWHQALAMAFLVMAPMIVCEASSGIALGANQVRDFTSVAKVAVPSVVSIKVRSDKKNFRGGMDDEADLLDPFLQRFFGSNSRDPRSQQYVPSLAQASGAIVGSDGLIITNNHVVSDASEILVTLNDGREFKAKVVGGDPNTDVALIRIDAKGLPALPFGNSDNLEVGQPVAAVGNPMGLQASMSSGIVSAKGRNNLDLSPLEDYIQTDAAINLGNSGGPLLNVDGEIVGINTAIVTATAGGGYMGIGFAIPSNVARQIAHQLLTDGKVTRGYLGITMQQIDHDLAQALGLPRIEGALISEVVKNSPADQGGLKHGDVILKYNQVPILNTASLQNAVAMMTPGSKLTLNVQRNGRMLNLPVEIAIFPEPEVEEARTVENFGFTVKALTPTVAQKYGYGNDQGVVVAEVFPGTPAAWAQLQVGALIQEVNRQPVPTLEKYRKALAAAEKGEPILFLVKQKGTVRYLSLKVK